MKITGDPKVLRDAAKKAEVRPEPRKIKLTDAQQAAMYYSRQRKRRAAGPAPHEE